MHRIAFWISVSIALTTIAATPTSSAVDLEEPEWAPPCYYDGCCYAPCDPCDRIRLCDIIADPGRVYVEDDGRHIEVGREYCSWYGCYREPIAVVDTCDTNPAAILNVCTTREDNTQTIHGYGVTWENTPVNAPGVGLGSRYRCLVGSVGCGYYPDPYTTWTTYNVPTPEAGPQDYPVQGKSVSAYVEVTPLCELGFDCRVGTSDGSNVLPGVLA